MFNINQIFENIYPIEAAEWCNANNCYIEEIESIDGVRRFEIKEVVPYVETEEEKQQRIARLKLTKREVFLGLYKALGVTPEQVRANIADPEALIEFDYATEYYRGNPLINAVGITLGLTYEQLDRFFETNDYKTLIGEVANE